VARNCNLSPISTYAAFEFGDGAVYIAERWPKKTPRFSFACSVASFGCQRSLLSSAIFGCSMFACVFHFYNECYGRQSRDNTSEKTWATPELATPERMPMPITGSELPA